MDLLSPIRVSHPRTLPDDLLLRIFALLPLPDLGRVARASRRFRKLTQDDAIWMPKLRLFKVQLDSSNGHGQPRPSEDETSPIFDEFVSAPTQSLSSALFDVDLNDRQNDLFDFTSEVVASRRMQSKKPSVSLGNASQAKEHFRKIYKQVMPYYLDLRNKTTDSRLFRDFKDPEAQAGMLVKMVALESLEPTKDWQYIHGPLMTVIEFFENAALSHFEQAYDSLNIPQMKRYAEIMDDLNGGLALTQIFVQKHPIFFQDHHDAKENIRSDANGMPALDMNPLDEFINHISSVFVRQAPLIAQVFPKPVDVLAAFAERVIDDVIAEYVVDLLEEARRRDQYIHLKATSAAFRHIFRLVSTLTEVVRPHPLTRTRAEDLLYQMYEVNMPLYLQGEIAYIRSKTDEEISSWDEKMANDDANLENSFLLNNPQREVYKRNFLTSFKKVILLPVTITTSTINTIASATSTPQSLTVSSSPSPSRSTTPDPTQGAQPTNQLNKRLSAMPSKGQANSEVDLHQQLLSARLAKMQTLLSLETALKIIHFNREALQRLRVFAGYPDRIGYDVKSTREQIFIALLTKLGNSHIKTGFGTAIDHLSQFVPTDETSVAPLLQFFELVHIGDMMQQMVDAYFDQEMASFIDRTDFMNNVVKEKKIFEQILDECVASGLNKGIEVLMHQVEFILNSEQGVFDYNPQDDVNSLEPTKACADAIKCLDTHTRLLFGVTDKNTMDVFLSEVGIRLFSVLSKHLKKNKISLAGGWQVIADLNAYHAYIAGLHQKTVTPYFLALKELGNIYIIDSAKDIGAIVRDVERYGGVLRPEDVYEFVQLRKDWKIVQKEVEKQMFGLKAEDCVIS